jgi:hypothetical protein
MPSSMPMVVVFPLPLGPRKPKTWPFSTASETWSTAVRLPYRFVSPSVSRIIMGTESTGRRKRLPSPCAHSCAAHTHRKSSLARSE